MKNELKSLDKIDSYSEKIILDFINYTSNCYCSMADQLIEIFNSLNLNKFQPVRIINLQKLIKVIGEIEHSSDWDLYLRIDYLNDNNKIDSFETPIGYWEIVNFDKDFIFIESLPKDEYKYSDKEELKEILCNPFLDEKINCFKIPYYRLNKIMMFQA